MPKKDYTTQTEKAEAALDEKLEALPTQAARRVALKAAAKVVPEVGKSKGSTINGKEQVALESARPEEVKANPFGKKKKAKESV